jgi:hypothetical protein
VAGANGTNGTNGSNAYTLTTADFNVPAAPGSSVTIAVADSAWMIPGQILIATGPATFVVTSVPSTTSVALMFLGYPGDVAGGTAILTGAKVGVGGQRGGSTVYYYTTAVDLTATAFMDVISVSVTGKTVTLPTAIGITGKIYTVKVTAAGGSTVATTAGQTIDGLTTFVLNGQNSFVSMISDGANWRVIVRFTNHYTSTAVDTAISAAMDVVEVTADNKTMTLPTAVGIVGKMYVFKQTAAYTSGTVIQPAGGETIDGAGSKTIAVQYGFCTVVSNGVNWIMLANKLS